MELVRLLALACESHNLAAIESLLAADVVAVCDGGGRVPAPREPVRGATDVALLLLTLMAGALLSVETVNARPGLVARRADGRPMAVLVAAGSPRKIAVLWIVLNPDKLRRWSLPS